MKKGIIALLVVVGLIIVIAMSISGSYNSINKAKINANKTWADVEGAYQRRADLIPNLVSTVKGAAEFEKSTLTQVIEARAKATSMKVDANDLTEEKLQQFQQAQGQLSQALGRLMVVSERYPELRATESFRDLQNQLEGTENRINVERRNFNNAVASYEELRTKMPNRLYSGMFGFEKMGMFKSEAGSEKAPTVEF